MSLLTEEDAKAKWCPMARSLHHYLVTDKEFGGTKAVFEGAPNRLYRSFDNVSDANPPWSRCIGSTCMAWREVTPAHDPMHRSDGTEYFAKPARGYCGAFGKPADADR